MKDPPWAIAAAIALAAWMILTAFMLFDTPRRIREAARVTPSPSYWHWLDWKDPREDTAHYETGGQNHE